MKIDCHDETNKIPLECSIIRGLLGGVIGQKSLGTINSATRSTVSAPKIRSDVDDLKIKVVSFGNVKISHVENPFT